MADTPQPSFTSSIEDQIRLREQKAQALREKGAHPYGNGVAVTHTTAFVRTRHEDDDAAHLEEDETEAYAIAGRVVALRSMGKASFLSLRDRSGDLQVFVKKDKVGEQAYELLKLTDLGDIAFARGRAMRTRTGELSIEAAEFRLLTKALRPLPEKWHGLTDHETRYRQRYVDLSANLDVREIFRRRTKLIAGIRAFLDERDFIEVEPPVLHKPEEAGGATARPFETHHNALDLDLKLRIALELHLKRLIVGGLERVYEIGRVFRNEGIDRRHNPEFTMLEFYQAYATYEDLMLLTEQMISPLARKRDSEPRLVDRFEAFAGGMEIANAFSELNDPRDQESRFRAQVEAAARGNPEAMPWDRDYIRALEHGMPPTAGEGVGIDRLAMILTDSPSIRDVVLFPLLKPEENR